MTEARLIELKEMYACLEHLKEIRKALNDENRPHVDVSIVVHCEDMTFDDMLLKGFPAFEEEFSKFISTHLCRLQKAFDEA